MIPPQLVEAINNQIHHELHSAYHYLAMAAHFEAVGFDGFAHWMELQHQEEVQHAMRLFRYVHDRGGQVVLQTIEAPRIREGKPIDVFEQALELEKENTAAIHRLYATATDLKDYPTISHLQWFLDEQVEEESSIDKILAHLRVAGSDASALLILNERLGQRTAED